MNWPLNHFVDHKVGLKGQKSSRIKKSKKSRKQPQNRKRPKTKKNEKKLNP